PRCTPSKLPTSIAHGACEMVEASSMATGTAPWLIDAACSMGLGSRTAQAFLGYGMQRTIRGILGGHDLDHCPVSLGVKNRSRFGRTRQSCEVGGSLGIGARPRLVGHCPGLSVRVYDVDRITT